MRKLTLLFTLIVLPLVASAQWEFDSYAPADTSRWDKITDVHGLVVDKSDNVWIQPYYWKEFIGEDSVRASAIYVFDSDGNELDFSPITMLKDADGNIIDTMGVANGDWLVGAGMRLDDDGNILAVFENMLYRLSSEDGHMLNMTETPLLDETSGTVKVAPAVDISGNVYIASVFPNNPIYKYEKDFGEGSNPEVIIPASDGFSRSFEVSSDGNTIYYAGYNNGYVLVYNRESDLDPFGVPDTVARGIKSESFTFNPASGQLWISGGSLNDFPSEPWTPNTWYAFETDDLNNPVDSLYWFSALTAPDDDRAITFDGSRPRALAFTQDGLTAYIGAFSHNTFLTDEAGEPVRTPALQKIVDKTDRSVQVDFTWNFSDIFPPDTNAQFTSTHGVAVDGDGKIWIQPYSATEPLTVDGVEETTNALYVFNPDGTQVDFSPLTLLEYEDGSVDTVGWYVNAGGEWESLTGRGLKADNQGNILVSTDGVLYRVNKDGSGMNRFDYVSSMTAAAVDDQDNVYIGPVVGTANDLIKLPPNFNVSTTPEVIISNPPGIARALEVSGDGNRIYWPAFTLGAVYVYEREDDLVPFDPDTFTLMEGLKAESMVYHPTTGHIWMSAGSPADFPSEGFASQTWYSFDESDLTNPIESITWNNEAREGYGDGRPRGIAFSDDGEIAYVGNFNEIAPSVQVFQGKTATSIDEPVSQLPSNFQLEQNYPNPFNPTTAINFRLPAAGQATLQVFDINGRLVSTLVNREMLAGQHTVNFDASNLSSGVYIYRLQAGDFSLTRKMTLIK